MAANRDPCSQPHVQAEITRDIEMSGSGGKTQGKFLKICILLWLKMPLPAVFKYFLETKTLLPILEKAILCLLFKNLRDHFLTDLPDRPDPPPPTNFITFCENLEDQLSREYLDPPFPPPLGTPLLLNLLYLKPINRSAISGKRNVSLYPGYQSQKIIKRNFLSFKF